MVRTSPVCAIALVFVVGCGSSTAEPDPNAWSQAFDASETGWLLSVWGPSADRLYAVGGAPDTGVVMRFDGATWSPEVLGIEVPLLNWVYGFSATDVTMVGSEGTVVHFDGSAWAKQDTPSDSALWGVWGAAPNDLWAVGGDGRREETRVVMRYDGSTWRDVTPPMLMRAQVAAFFKVWGTSADDVWIVGQRGIILHWDGTAISEVPSGTGDDLISLWGTGPDNIVAVGGRGRATLSRFDGAAWTSHSLSPLGGLNGVWMRTPNVVHAVGISGARITIALPGLAVTETDPDTNFDYHAIFGDPTGTITAVGGNLANPDGPYQGIASRRRLHDKE